jgi:toxin secretion/phage lysis holin
VLTVFIAVDFILGILVGALGRSPNTEGGGISSQAATMGISRKIFVFGLVAVGSGLDRLTGANDVVRTAVCWFYIASEGLSILENGALLGHNPPALLVTALEALKHRASQPQAKPSEPVSTEPKE